MKITYLFFALISTYMGQTMAESMDITKRHVSQHETLTPNDFDFEIGRWQVKHRRLKNLFNESEGWIEFDGHSSTIKILGGFGNVEDNILHFPEGAFRAAAIRSYDNDNKTWSIWWLDGRFPNKLDVPVVGSFKNSIGHFYAEDVLNGKPTKVRFIWDSRVPDNPKWEQAFSTDNGVTWKTNWTMSFLPMQSSSNKK